MCVYIHLYTHMASWRVRRRRDPGIPAVAASTGPDTTRNTKNNCYCADNTVNKKQQTNKQANKQTNKQTSKHTNKQTVTASTQNRYRALRTSRARRPGPGGGGEAGIRQGPPQTISLSLSIYLSLSLSLYIYIYKWTIHILITKIDKDPTQHPRCYCESLAERFLK